MNNLGETAFVSIAPLLAIALAGQSSVFLFHLASSVSGFLSIVTGVYVDSRTWRKVFCSGIALQSITSLWLFWMLVSGQSAPETVLFSLFFVNSIGAIAYMQAWIVGVGFWFRDYRRRARVSLRTGYAVASVLGPLLAAIMMRHGLAALLIFNLATFSAPILSLLVLKRRCQVQSYFNSRIPIAESAVQHEQRSLNIFRKIGQAWKFTWSRQEILSLLWLRMAYVILPLGFLPALIILRLGTSYSPLLVVSVVNFGFYLGSQSVSLQTDFSPRLSVPSSCLLMALSAALLPLAVPFFVLGVVLLSMAAGALASYFVAASSVFVPVERVGSLTGVNGLATSTVATVASLGLAAYGQNSLLFCYYHVAIAVLFTSVGAVVHLRIVSRMQFSSI